MNRDIQNKGRAAGKQNGQGKSKTQSFVSHNYSTLNAVDAALMMASFTLGYIAGVLL